MDHQMKMDKACVIWERLGFRIWNFLVIKDLRYPKASALINLWYSPEDWS